MDYDNGKLNTLLSSVKLLMLISSAFMLFQEVFADQTPTEILMEGPTFFLLSVVFLIGLFLAWFFIGFRFSDQEKRLQRVQNITMVVLITGVLIATAAYGQEYKHLFFLVAIIVTIENGLRWGIIASMQFVILYTVALITFHGRAHMMIESNIFLALELLVTVYILGYYTKEKEKHIDLLEEFAQKDGLTGLYNHRFLISYLEEGIKAYQDKRKPLSLILIDTDDFKTYNEFHGHVQGDLVLKQLSEIFIQHAKKGIVCRQGGDEFAIAGPYTEAQAMTVAKNILEQVRSTSFFGEQFLPNKKLTVSIGVAKMHDRIKNTDGLISDTDIALYRAKFMDKNQIRKYEDLFDRFDEEDEFSHDMFTAIRTLITVINTRDDYTYSHIEQVVQYVKEFVEEYGFDEKNKRNLLYAAYMHDIGKINVPTHVLMKKGQLEDEEREMLQRHPKWGAQIISDLGYDPEIIPVIEQHHEFFDGTGYPSGLSGENINPMARLLAVIDGFDAMTNMRPYRKSMSKAEAIDELMRCAGSQFDPQYVQMFVAFLKGKYADELADVHISDS